ncbi:MAG: tyrosine-type recombinase/integrase [Deltaproteobacteria bacterium]|nr:tyrosine-type recombinase/integrase [Deltaproteobacteria bacterium]
MLSHSTGWLRIAVALATYAGLRCGEVRALEVQDVDLQTDLLRVRRAFAENEVLTPKSGHERVVPIASELRSILVEAVRAKLPRARVVPNERGHTPTRQAVLTALKRMQERHELRTRSFHSLRRAFCSGLFRGGASVAAVRLLAGHSDLATTQRCVHASAGDLAAAVAKLRVTSG